MLPLFLTLLLAQSPAGETVSVRTLAPSGVRLLLCPRPDGNTVAIAAGFRIGSAFDGAATCGCAHLLEHVMLFRGTELSGYEDVARRWRELGAQPSGSTYPDYTLFKASVPKDGVGRALELLREMLLHPGFSVSDLARERKVVIAELATLEQDPLLQAYRFATQALYGEHNYGLPGFGYPRVLEEISATTLYSRFDSEYTPGRITLALVGPVTEDAVRRALEETFGTYRLGKTAAPEVGELPPIEPGPPLVGTSPAPLAQLVFAFRGPPSGSKDWLPFVVMARILCGGEGSRLRERLVHQDGIAKNVSLVAEPRVGGGFALFRVQLAPELIGRCEREVRRILARLAERPLDPAVVERVTNRLRLEFAQRTESPEALASELVSWDMLSTWSFPLAIREELARVTMEQVSRVGQLYFAPAKAKVVTVVP